MAFIMALDQGTSSSRAVIYDAQGVLQASAQQPISPSYPQDGWVEQDPMEIWQSILSVGRRALTEAGLQGSDLTGIGITNQRETTLLWDRHNGDCLYNAIVWQDRRGAAQCKALAEAKAVDGASVAEIIQHQTGLIIDPYFSSTKLSWLLDTVPGARERAEAGDLCFGTVDSFLIWHLTCGRRHVTDASNASRTQLFDIRSQQWSPVLLDVFAVPPELLPEVLDNTGEFGVADPQWFGAAIPICGVAGDQQAALIGQACFEPGMSKSTYGTGCFVMTNTGSEIPHSSQRLLSTVAYRLGGQTTYALEGSIFVAGAAVQWLRDSLCLIDDAAETEAAFRRSAGDSGGVFVVPALSGLGAPYWRPDARGLITGLTFQSDRDQVITAFLQSMGFQTLALLRAMVADNAPVTTLRVDGGMVVNDALCQFLADLLQVPVERPEDVETTVRGAGVLAAMGSGLVEDFGAAAEAWQLNRAFVPRMESSRRQTLVEGYDAAIRQVLAATKQPENDG